MNYPYTIDDLSRLVKVSKQSVYYQIGKNKSFVAENSRKINRKIKYNQAVLDMLLEYYGANEVIEEPENAPETASEPPIEETKDNTNDEAEAKITALQAQLEAAQKELQAKEAERQELIKQNGLLMLLLQQEKQEKQALLPAPKKTFGEKIKAFFSH